MLRKLMGFEEKHFVWLMEECRMRHLAYERSLERFGAARPIGFASAARVSSLHSLHNPSSTAGLGHFPWRGGP